MVRNLCLSGANKEKQRDGDQAEAARDKKCGDKEDCEFIVLFNDEM